MDRSEQGLESAEILRERLARLRELWGGAIDPGDGLVPSVAEGVGVSPATALPDDLTTFRRQVAELMRLIHPEDALTEPPPKPAPPVATAVDVSAAKVDR